MIILKNAGSHEILTTRSELQEQFLGIEKAGRTCYQSENKPITIESSTKFIKMLIKRGHESVIEHSYMTVRFSNISRGFTHEMVRHRLCAFSQESTRYVDYAKKGEGVDLDKFQVNWVIPPHKEAAEIIQVPERGCEMTVGDMVGDIEVYYRALRKAGWSPEDARQILPIGIRSQIVVSANFREWRHIFNMRTTKPAHWEIRRVMGNLLTEIQNIIPVVFDDLTVAGVDKNDLRYFAKSNKDQNGAKS